MIKKQKPSPSLKPVSPKEMSRPRVFVTRKLPDSVETRMAELFDVTLNRCDAPFGKEKLIEAIKGQDILVPTVTDRIDRDVIAAFAKDAQSPLKGPPKLIANFGAGVDHIDLKAAHEAGVFVSNTPGVLTEDTADLAMALLLSVPRRLFEGEKILREGRWTGWTPTFLMGRRIEGKRLGIIGMGRIGQAIAKRARAFNIRVHYHNRSRLPLSVERALEATYWPDLDDMLARMDFISINCPLTEKTRHLLNRDRLMKMQPHAVLINTARGEIIDEEALADLLSVGRIAGAGLDVFAGEPQINKKLLALDNLVLVPHMGSATVEARQAMGEKVLINIRSFMDGHHIPDRVIPDRAISDRALGE